MSVGSGVFQAEEPMVNEGRREENGVRAEESMTDRRTFLQSAAVGAAALALPKWARGAADEDIGAIRGEIEKRHDEAVKRLQHWIQQPSIAAENRGMNEGCELMMQMLREAGFEQVTKMPALRAPSGFITCTT